MNINATLLGQMLVFGVLIWFSWKFIWPPLTKAVEDRQKKIAEGLAAAERGQKELQQSHGEAAGIVSEAREKALKIVEQANRRSNELIDEARVTAISEGQRLVGDARQEVQLEQARARVELRKDVAQLAVAGASRLLDRPEGARRPDRQARSRDRGCQGLTAAAPRAGVTTDGRKSHRSKTLRQGGVRARARGRPRGAVVRLARDSAQRGRER